MSADVKYHPGLFPVGARVRFRETVERWPLFAVPAGMRGTIKVSDNDLLAVLPDDPAIREAASDWDGCAEWYPMHHLEGQDWAAAAKELEIVGWATDENGEVPDAAMGCLNCGEPAASPAPCHACEPESLADHEEASKTLEEFCEKVYGESGDLALVMAYDLLDDLYEATDTPRRLLKGWIRVRSAAAPHDSVRRENAEDKRRAQAYADYMSEAQGEWAELCAKIEEYGKGAGLAAEVWQTGGGCLAIGITAPDRDGRHVMLTDTDGPLSLRREEYAEYAPRDLPRWAVGLYLTDADGEEAGTVFTSAARLRAEDDDWFAREVADLASLFIAEKSAW